MLQNCGNLPFIFILNSYLPLLKPLRKKATIHQVTTMPTTSKNVLFPGHNQLLTNGADDPSLSLSPAGSYDLEIGHFQKWLAWWLPGG